MYPEYTGTAWNMVLKESGAYQEDEFPALKKDTNQTMTCNGSACMALITPMASPFDGILQRSTSYGPIRI